LLLIMKIETVAGSGYFFVVQLSRAARELKGPFTQTIEILVARPRTTKDRINTNNVAQCCSASHDKNFFVCSSAWAAQKKTSS
jgi:hypothetical protein